MSDSKKDDGVKRLVDDHRDAFKGGYTPPPPTESRRPLPAPSGSTSEPDKSKE